MIHLNDLKSVLTELINSWVIKYPRVIWILKNEDIDSFS